MAFVDDSRRFGMWTAAGWLGVVGGAFTSLVSGGALVFIAALAAQGRPITVRHGDALPGYLPLLYSDARLLPSMFCFAAVLALVAGIGLIRRRHYGRTLTLAFGVLSIGWFLFASAHLWLAVFSAASQDSPFLFRLAPAVLTTPIGLAYCVAVGLLCRSVLRHPEAFTGAVGRGA
jgi:hypothetical protein